MNLPSIPDNIYKFLLYIGIIMLGYSIIQAIDSAKNYNTLVNNSNSFIDSLTIREMTLTHESDGLFTIADELSKKYKIENPITRNDSTTYFNMTLIGSKIEVLVSDSLKRLWNSLKKQYFEIDLLTEKIKMSKSNLKESANEYNQKDRFYMVTAFLGLLFAFGGYSGFQKLQTLQEKLITLEISLKDKKYKHCQSCGKQFSSIRLNGHDKNGEINTAFCIDCFDDGKFKEPDLTIDEFKKRVDIILTGEKLKKKELKAHFESLERWKKSEYI